MDEIEPLATDRKQVSHMRKTAKHTSSPRLRAAAIPVNRHYSCALGVIA